MGDLFFLVPVMGIIMGVSIPITALKLKHKEKIEQMRLAAAAAGRQGDNGLARRDARIEQLEDRLAVLERIVTDRSYGLAHQIEALRDTDATPGVPLAFDRKPASTVQGA